MAIQKLFNFGFNSLRNTYCKSSILCHTAPRSVSKNRWDNLQYCNCWYLHTP